MISQRHRFLQILIVLILMIFQYPVFALEMTVSGQNEARWGRGEPVDDSSDDSYAYFENYLDLNVHLNNFRFYLRQAYLLPSVPELGGIRQSGWDAFDKWHIGYESDGLSLRGGDFYRTYGRGLLFGTVEFIDLGFDTGLEGVLIEGYTQRQDFVLQGALFRGVEPDTSGNFNEAAEGVWLSCQVDRWIPMDRLRLGGLINRLDDGPRHPVINRHGFELETEWGATNLFAAYITDRLDRNITGEPEDYYSGLYSAVSFSDYFGDDLSYSLLLDYKNYDLFTYDDPAQNIAGQPPLLFPATGMPEATMFLLDRHPRIQNFNDDVGWQMEFNGGYGDWSFLLNVNQSSERKDGNAIIPTIEEEYSPYQAVFAKLERDRYDGDHFSVQAGAHQDVQFTYTATGGYSQWIERTAVGGLYEHRFGEVYSISAELELMSILEKHRGSRFDDQYIGLSLSRSPDIISTVMLERSNVPEIGGIRDNTYRYWPSGEITLNFLQRHQIRLFGGYERGGLKCSGGVCRFVNPFKGVKMTLTSRF